MSSISSGAASFTPWELASLKVAFHRADLHHQGFLTLDAVERLFYQLLKNESALTSRPLFRHALAVVHSAGWPPTTEIAVALPSSLSNTAVALAEHVFDLADADGDRHITFDELVDVLALSNDPGVLLLKEALLDPAVCLVAGTTFSFLIVKGKLAAAVGTLFYDPIRLFRGSYVDPAFTSRSSAESWKRVALRNVGIASAALTADCCIGAVMFVTYGMARSALYRRASVAERKGRRGTLEFLSGCVGGVVSGVVLEAVAAWRHYRQERLRAQATSLKHHSLRWHMHHSMVPAADAGVHSVQAVLFRHSIAHGIFFATFYKSNHALYHVMYGTDAAGRLSPHESVAPLDSTGSAPDGANVRVATQSSAAARTAWMNRTSWTDTMLTSAAGCCAGAAYRMWSVPTGNVMAARARFDPCVDASIPMPVGRRGRAVASLMVRGLATSLAWTMPVSGLAFLVYEALLIRI